MQTIITWNALLIYLFIFLLCYYAAVLALFYRYDLVKMSSRFKKTGTLSLEEDEPDDAVEQSKDITEQIQEIIKDCRSIFSNVTNAPVNRAKLIEDFRIKISKYPDVKGSPYQISLTNHIEQETENRLGIWLSDDELNSIWE